LRRRTPFLCSVGALLLLAALPGASAREKAAPQAPTPQDDAAVQLSSNLVTVTVVVRDASGNLVTDLTADAFSVFEDGAPQQVDQLYRQGEVPLRLAFLFDVSLSVKFRIDFERRAAAKFFADALKRGDRAALFSVATEWRLEQELTESPDTLVNAMQKLEVGGITSLYGAITEAARYLDAVEGRRVVVVLSDGYDTAQEQTLEETLASVHRADAVVYAISPVGVGADVSTAGRIGAAALRQLSAETGGRAFFPPVKAKREEEAADLDAIYRTIVDEIRSEYVLTYYSTKPGSGGEFRTLRVEVRRPGLSVSTRKGYFAR
jgi:Ca-activated chloride channel family protein